MFLRKQKNQFRLSSKQSFALQLGALSGLFVFLLYFPQVVKAAEPSAELLSKHSQTSEFDNSPLFLDAMVITGSRTLKPLADTPVRTLVMDSDSIQKLHSRDIRDALRMLPGVQLREIHGKTGEEVMLQGFDGNRVLILVDGLPVSATTASTV
ncbi:MAG: TonB-dependent receptor plug domain-containing protein, partial [Thalassolituus sp.]